VGHLGTPQLAALALAAALLSAVVSLCNFLTYATTAHVARLHGAGREADAGQLAAQALWLALVIGCCLAAICAVAAAPLMTLLGGSGHVADLAARYLRLSALGLPFALTALAGQGWLRGMSRLREPLVILLAANAANVVLEIVLVYGLGLGLDGSALGTVVAQLGMGAAFAALLLRADAPSRRVTWSGIRALLSIGGAILIRTGSLLGSFTVASAVCARFGAPSLGAHQIAFQLFIFLALVLDAIAIAGQVIVGRMLGASDAEGARMAARRMLFWALVVGCVFGLALLALQGVLPRVFSSDARVIDKAQVLWPLFALMQPAGAVVFALDGILIGAGDARYLAAAMVFAGLFVFVPISLAALHFDWGLAGVWWGLNALMVARLATLGVRFASGRWVVLGA
jgi:putative MATE family efflux protein